MTGGPKTISLWQLLGIIAICAAVGTGLGYLYCIHPLVMVAAILLLAFIGVLIYEYREVQKPPRLLIIIFAAAFMVSLGLGLYLGLNDPFVRDTEVLQDARVKAAVEARSDVGPADGEVTSGTYIILRRKDKNEAYKTCYFSDGRMTRSKMEKLQTVIIVSDYTVIDSGKYVLKQGGKQVGESVTFHQYRLELRYFDVVKGEVVRFETIDGEPLTKEGGGGEIPDSVIIEAVKKTMAEADKQQQSVKGAS